MVSDTQIQQLFRFLATGMPLYRAAWKTGISENTARKYVRARKLPTELARPHAWETRHDPFVRVWPIVRRQLERSPGLRPTTLFRWLQRQFPGEFRDGQLRTLQRRVKQWKAIAGPPREVFFEQQHRPGETAACDFTDAQSLGITIADQHQPQVLFHFVMTYSNWESVTACPSENLESLHQGLQNALWTLSGVPVRLRTDRMTILNQDVEEIINFNRSWQQLIEHYGLKWQPTSPGKPHHNGDVEASHRHLKDAIAQALMLRGSRNFRSQNEYQQFLDDLVCQRNQSRQTRFLEELKLLRPLPAGRLESCRYMRVRVDRGSLIHIESNVYSVDSRLIGELVDVRTYRDRIEVWFAKQLRASMPRLLGRGKHRIDYRHVIDSLIRKPGGFERYLYRDSLFPTTRFADLYQHLVTTESRKRASFFYLSVLKLASRTSEESVDRSLDQLLQQTKTFDCEAVTHWFRQAGYVLFD